MRLFLFIVILMHGTTMNVFSQTDTTISLYFKSGYFIPEAGELKKLFYVMGIDTRIQSITGNTDTVGSNPQNLILSNKRSQYIAQYLHDQFNIAINYPVLYFGEERPVSNANNALNRRVDIIMTKSNHSSLDTITIKVTDSLKYSIYKRYTFENIYFVPDKPVIESYSLLSVNDIADILKHYKTEIFEIRGHVNVPLWYKGQTDTMYINKMKLLSFNRAKEIYNRLVEKGIPAKRMTYKGMGNTEMIYPNARSEKEMRKNMRVEVIILRRD